MSNREFLRNRIDYHIDYGVQVKDVTVSAYILPNFTAEEVNSLKEKREDISNLLNLKPYTRKYKDGRIVGKRCNCNDECPPEMICVNGVCVPAEKQYNIKEDRDTGLYVTYEVYYV